MPGQTTITDDKQPSFGDFVRLFLASFVLVMLAILAIAFIVNSCGKYAPLPPLFLVVLTSYFLAVFLFIPYGKKIKYAGNNHGKPRILIYKDSAKKQSADTVFKSDEYLIEREPLKAEELPSLDKLAKQRLPLTMMFTDIVDSTMMTEINGEEFAYEIMHVHNAIAAKAITDFKGRRVKLMGDGVFACFKNPQDGVLAAIQMQKDFSTFNRNNPGKVFLVRIGLNSGNPLVEDGDLFGLCVGRASRVCHAAKGGSIFVTYDLYDELSGAGFKLKDEGLFGFKGIVQKERVYSVNWMAYSNDYDKADV